MAEASSYRLKLILQQVQFFFQDIPYVKNVQANLFKFFF